MDFYTLPSHAIATDGMPARAFATHRPRASEVARQYSLDNPLGSISGVIDEGKTIILISHLQAASDDPNFHVPDQKLSRDLVIEVLKKLEMKEDGEVGTDFQPFKDGDYDMALKGLMVILYRYRHLLGDDEGEVQDVLYFILDKLVPSELSGPHDPDLESWRILTEGIPETENHMLMINSTRYLVNQLLFDRFGDTEYDNTRNGLKNWLLRYMHTIAKHDFLEFNSRPYQRLSLHALLNLHEFARDKEIRTAAQILLDYTMVKFAVSSNRLRRIPPFRRLKKYVNRPDNAHNDLQIPKSPEGKDAVIGFFFMYIGPTTNIGDGRPTNKFPAIWAFEAIIAGLSAYRPPVAAYNLVMNQNRDHAFQHRFYHGSRPVLPGTDDQAEGGVEIYYNSPSFLLTAGGMFLNSGYGGDEWVFVNYKDTAIAQSTTLIPTRANVKFEDIIRFDPYPDDRRAVNTGVHEGFAIGTDLRPSEQKIFGETTYHASALTSHAGRLYLAWTGRGNEHINVAKVYITEALDIFGIENLEQKVVLNDTSDQSPAMASHNGRLYLAWKGSGNDNLNMMFSDDNGASFRGKMTFNETSHHSPVLASHGGHLYLAWTGRGDGNLNVAKVTLFGNTAGGFGIEGLEDKIVLGDTSEQSPALVSHNGRLFLAWKGAGNDNLNLMFSEDNGASFIGKTTFNETSHHAPVLASHGGRLFLAWTGRGDGNLNVAKVTLFGNTAGGFGIEGLEDKVVLVETSDQSPALASHDVQLYLAWKGSGNNNLNLFASDDGLFRMESWIIRDLSRLGFYIAIYRTPPEYQLYTDIRRLNNLGLLYAYDRTTKSEPMDFETFKERTLKRNTTLPDKFDYWKQYVFHTADDHRFNFSFSGGNKYQPRIFRMDEVNVVANSDFRSLPLVEGKYLNVPGGHDGKIEIRYPGCDTPLVLDFRIHWNPVRQENILACPQPWIDRVKALLKVAAELIEPKLTSQAVAQVREAVQLMFQLIPSGLASQVVAQVREAVQLYQQIAAVSGADVISIAQNLWHLSDLLASVGFYAEAVEPAFAALDVLRRFQSTAYPQLANAFYILSYRLIQAGRGGEAVGPAREAVQVYRRLAEGDPNQFRPLLQNAEQLLASLTQANYHKDIILNLRRVGIDFSVSEENLRQWLNNPTFTPYPAIAAALLRMLVGKRLRKPVFLDVIVFNYEHAPGAVSPRRESDVNLALLRASVVVGYNKRYGEFESDFNNLVV